MSHIVKCKICGESFDRDEVSFIKIKNRYAHANCQEKAQQDASELRKLTDLIQQLYRPVKPDWSMITAQIQRFRKTGKTYMGMYYTLYYHYIIQGNKLDKDKGIGIIPYKYEKAKAYYTNIDNIYTKTAEIQNREEIKVAQNENIITITQRKPKKKLLDFSYED